LRGCLNLYKNLLQGQFETSVYESAVAIRGNNLLQAREHSKRAREILGPVLMPPAQRQNKRAMIRYLNYLEVTQLDEIIDFLSSATPSNAKAILEDLKQTWNQRLLDLDYSLDVWRRLIPIRAILLSPTGEDIDTWVRFSTLSRKKQNLVLSQRIVQRLQTARPDYHGVILSEIKNQYAQGRINDAIDGLESFLHTENLISQCTPYLLAKCFLALGMWLPATDPRVAQYVGRSVQLDPKGYKAQSTQALIKFREAQTRGFGPHISEAVESLFRAIQLASRVQLPDVLRLLTLWFSFYGQDMFLDEQFEKGFSSVPLLTWTHAIPQILARLRSRRVKLRDSIHRLLVRLGLEYPQSVVFALTVASASEANDSLVVHSKQILSKISEQYPDLVQQCELVARELVRIASSWIEQWCAALEEASRLYFVDKDLGGMLRKLSAIHSQMNRNRPETPQETSFAQKYGEELEMAWSWVRKYIETHNSFFLDQAWGIYYQVFQKLHQQVGLVKQVVLARVSPQLNILHDTCLLLPSSSEVFIHSFLSSIEIVSSKQRPRAMQIVGSDGRSYKYLLKANEDLKQDERVMQLFGLINTVITDSVASRRRSGVFPTTPGIETLEDVHLKRYAVVPLSQNAGLIEWVDECDTLHALIKSRRDVLGIPVSLEHNLMRHIYTQYEDLPLTERVQVFEYALSETSGTELRDSMWLSSRGCETWLRRRSMYARSLAVNSIVGYFLGLGDRHPSNLMIDRNSGQVIHIDFGDCFDVAATRDRYPEKVPFRLTRQLVNALEACGVEGTFRVTAERMMDLIRKNSDSIMAMLEAFIYDPLLTWRILPDGKDAESLNARAKEVVERVHAKLAGEDLSVTAHVDQLIREAVAHENLCQCYLGWCPFW
jgi:FKBP12-rapamycin complex-associated protein